MELLEAMTENLKNGRCGGAFTHRTDMCSARLVHFTPRPTLLYSRPVRVPGGVLAAGGDGGGVGGAVR